MHMYTVICSLTMLFLLCNLHEEEYYVNESQTLNKRICGKTASPTNTSTRDTRFIFNDWTHCPHVNKTVDGAEEYTYGIAGYLPLEREYTESRVHENQESLCRPTRSKSQNLSMKNFTLVALCCLTVILMMVMRKKLNGFFKIESGKYGNRELVRKAWPDNDPTLISEGLFAVANVFSFARIIYLFQRTTWRVEDDFWLKLNRLEMDQLLEDPYFFRAENCNNNARPRRKVLRIPATIKEVPETVEEELTKNLDEAMKRITLLEEQFKNTLLNKQRSILAAQNRYLNAYKKMKEQLVFIDTIKQKLSDEMNVLGLYRQNYEKCICKLCRTVFSYTNYHCPILLPCGHSFGACCITGPVFYCALHQDYYDLSRHSFQEHINIQLMEFVADFMGAYTFDSHVNN